MHIRLRNRNPNERLEPRPPAWAGINLRSKLSPTKLKKALSMYRQRNYNAVSQVTRLFTTN